MTIPIVRQAPRNPRAASENRQILDSAGVTCLNLIGATGSGKTSILEAILPRISTELRVGVLEGDLETTRDAQRIGALGVPVVQVLSDGQCHLSADQLQRGLAELPLEQLDLVIVESVGGLCQEASYLGEHLRGALLCIAGGHAVAEKHPRLFRDADLILLTKYDLLPHVEFDLDLTLQALRQVNPRGEIICTDTRNRLGIGRLAGWLLGYARAQSMRDRPRGHAPEPLGLPT